MRRLQCALLAAVAVIGFASIASAADMPTKAPAAIAPYNWTGCYVGVNGGYGWNNGRSSYDDVNALGDPVNGRPNNGATLAFVPVPSDTGGSGGLGGVGAGCNWQSQRVVYGIEGDFDLTNFSGSQNTAVTAGPGAQIAVGAGAFFFLNGSATASEQVSLRWLSTVRGRVGFAAQDRLLLFVTGGLAVGQVNSQGSVNALSGKELARCRTLRLGPSPVPPHKNHS